MEINWEFTFFRLNKCVWGFLQDIVLVTLVKQKGLSPNSVKIKRAFLKACMSVVCQIWRCCGLHSFSTGSLAVTARPFSLTDDLLTMCLLKSI